MSPDPPTKPPGDGDPPVERPAEAAAARERAHRLHQRQSPDHAERKPWFQQLPTKLAAGVVFLVALTTLLGNLLELREKGRDVLPEVAPKPASFASDGSTSNGSTSAGTATAPAPSAAMQTGPVRLRVALDRIAVQDDGSPGTTDWRFTVEADGQPLFAFEQDDLDDSGGRNVVRPKDVDAPLRRAPGRQASLTVKGWRLSRLRLQGQPDAVGEGVLPVDGAEAAIKVAAPEASGGAFVFYFSADQQ